MLWSLQGSSSPKPTAQPTPALTATPTAPPTGEPTCFNCHGSSPVPPVCSSTGNRTGFTQKGPLYAVDLYILYEELYGRTLDEDCIGLENFKTPLVGHDGGDDYFTGGHTDDSVNFKKYEDNILSVQLDDNVTLNGTLTGPTCKFKGYSWIRVCYNDNYDRTSFDVPYFTLDSRGHKVHENKVVTLNVSLSTAIPIPELYPYIIDGTCPPGLLSVPSLCEPLPTPSRIPPPPVCSSTGKRVGSITEGSFEEVDLIKLYSYRFGNNADVRKDCVGAPDFDNNYYLNDDYLYGANILNAPLHYFFHEFDFRLNGTLTGPNCKLNNFTWIIVCYNADNENKTSLQVPYYTYDSKGQAAQSQSASLNVSANAVVPIPEYYPYIVEGHCPVCTLLPILGPNRSEE